MTTTLYIQNLEGSGCESTVINKLSKLKNIDKITIKLQYGTVTFEHESEEDIILAKKVLSKIGYPPFGEKNTLVKKAKSYASCVAGRIKN